MLSLLLVAGSCAVTESRETLRRRQYRDRAQLAAPSDIVPLTDLCLVVGCLRLRVGSNLCRMHDEQSNP